MFGEFAAYVMCMTNEQDHTTDESAIPEPTAATAPSGRVGSQQQKWPQSVMVRGHLMLPTLLLWGQARIGMNAQELNVALQLLSHWWRKDSDPHPSKETIARRMGIGARQVQRTLTQLENKRLIARKARYKSHKGQDSNAYDLGGLVRKLEEIAPEFENTKTQERLRRAKVETPKSTAA